MLEGPLLAAALEADHALTMALLLTRTMALLLTRAMALRPTPYTYYGPTPYRYYGHTAALEVDHALRARRQQREQVHGHLPVAHARHERARVDEGVGGRRELGEGLEKEQGVPVRRQVELRDDRRLGEGEQHLGVVTLLVDALAHLERQQRGGRACVVNHLVGVINDVRSSVSVSPRGRAW